MSEEEEAEVGRETRRAGGCVPAVTETEEEELGIHNLRANCGRRRVCCFMDHFPFYVSAVPTTALQ